MNIQHVNTNCCVAVVAVAVTFHREITQYAIPFNFFFAFHSRSRRYTIQQLSYAIFWYRSWPLLFDVHCTSMILSLRAHLFLHQSLRLSLVCSNICIYHYISFTLLVFYFSTSFPSGYFVFAAIHFVYLLSFCCCCCCCAPLAFFSALQPEILSALFFCCVHLSKIACTFFALLVKSLCIINHKRTCQMVITTAIFVNVIK